MTKAAADPSGPDNDEWLETWSEKADVVVAARGKHGPYLGRDTWLKGHVGNLHYLCLTKDGQPGHLPYLPVGLRPQPWLGT